VQIDKVRVQNFKSIQDSGWVSLEDDLTALVGENEAGKSNFLEALSYIGRNKELPTDSLCKETIDDRRNLHRSNHDVISVRFSDSLFSKVLSPIAPIFPPKIVSYREITINAALQHMAEFKYIESLITEYGILNSNIIKSERKELEKHGLADLGKDIAISLQRNSTNKEILEKINKFLI
jgi:AAA15 family ATPase/GTPase